MQTNDIGNNTCQKHEYKTVKDKKLLKIQMPHLFQTKNTLDQAETGHY